ERAGTDGAERLPEIAAVARNVGNVARHPSAQHGEQVERVAPAIVRLPAAQEVVLEIVVSERAIELGAVEGLRSRPARVDARKGTKTAVGRVNEASAVPRRIAQ